MYLAVKQSFSVCVKFKFKFCSKAKSSLNCIYHGEGYKYYDQVSKFNWLPLN